MATKYYRRSGVRHELSAEDKRVIREVRQHVLSLIAELKRGK